MRYIDDEAGCSDDDEHDEDDEEETKSDRDFIAPDDDIQVVRGPRPLIPALEDSDDDIEQLMAEHKLHITRYQQGNENRLRIKLADQTFDNPVAHIFNSDAQYLTCTDDDEGRKTLKQLIQGDAFIRYKKEQGLGWQLLPTAIFNKES